MGEHETGEQEAGGLSASEREELHQFGSFLRETVDVTLDQLLAAVLAAGENFARVGESGLRDPLRTSLLTFAHSMETEDTEQMILHAQILGLGRAEDGFTIRELTNAVSALRQHLWRRVTSFLPGRPPWTPMLVRRLEDYIDLFHQHYIISFGDVLQQMRGELASQSQELAAQRAIIQELGVPVMPVHEGVLVLPLVGAIDSNRALQVMEVLLEAITQHQADMVIIDITGVPTVDTSVANYILQATRAANLVGAHVILVGINARLAQTIVQLGVDLTSITTLANLQEGLEYAYRQLGYRVV